MDWATAAVAIAVIFAVMVIVSTWLTTKRT
jgi:hypothetical protein